MSHEGREKACVSGLAHSRQSSIHSLTADGADLTTRNSRLNHNVCVLKVNGFISNNMQRVLSS